MIWLGLFLAATLAGFCFLWLIARYNLSRASSLLDYADVLDVKVPSGAKVVLRRLRRVEENESAVLLIHGLGTDHRHLDLLETRSLARHLAGRGFDVWLLCLRSGLPQRRKIDVGLESMMREDVPYAIDAICGATGHAQVDVLGYSMGGIVTLAALSDKSVAAKIRRTVIVASPGYVHKLHWLEETVQVPALLNLNLPLAMLAAAIAPISMFFSRYVTGKMINPRNAEASDMRALWLVSQDIPPSLVRSFMAWRRAPDRFAGGAFLFDHLRAMTRPALFLAGGADQVAPAACVQFLADRWGTATRAESTFVICAPPATLEPYGHADLLMGRTAEQEVFVRIADFLLAADSVASSPSPDSHASLPAI